MQSNPLFDMFCMACLIYKYEAVLNGIQEIKLLIQ
jgi:hypothetical protein